MASRQTLLRIIDFLNLISQFDIGITQICKAVGLFQNVKSIDLAINIDRLLFTHPVRPRPFIQKIDGIDG